MFKSGSTLVDAAILATALSALAAWNLQTGVEVSLLVFTAAIIIWVFGFRLPRIQL